jgi:aminoglycoside phosphotransferase (APT) family kinase protein
VDEGHVEGFSGELQVEKFKGGQSNPTFMLSAGGRKYVMRRKPPGKLLPSAHAVDREYKVITALAATDVPVAKTWALCTDDSVIGTMFYIMDCVDGRIMWDPALPGMTPAQRGAIFDEMNRVIAALHKVDYAAVGLADYGKPGSYFARQIDRWSKQYRASETEKIEAMDKLIEWLPQNIPAGDETSIVHGDFRLDNTVFHPTEPRMLAVLDWELSTLGHPLADFAYHCMTWRLSPGQFRGLAGNDLAALGIPSEAEYVAAYCRAPAAPRSRRATGSSAWPSTCSASPASCRASWPARCRATPRAPKPSKPASAPGRWPKKPGARSNACSPTTDTNHVKHKRKHHGLRLLPQGQGTAGPPQCLHGPAHLSQREGLPRRDRGQPRQGQPLGADQDHGGHEGKGARRRPVEPVPARIEIRRRPHQPRIRAAVRDHGPLLALRAGSLQLRRAQHRQHGSAGALRHARPTSRNGWCRCSKARSAPASP